MMESAPYKGGAPDLQHLQQLLEMLDLPPVAGLPAYAPRQRAPDLRRILEQSRRIAAKSGSREQIAVVEFHMGLYQSQWQEWSGAGQHFERARREALRGDNRRLACLALFALGCMRQLDYDFEGALAAFSEVEAKVQSMRRLLGVRGFDARENREHLFLDELEAVLEQAQHSLQADLEQEVTTRLETVPTDRIQRTIPLPATPPSAAPAPPPPAEPVMEDWTPIVGPALRVTQPQAPQVNFPATRPVAEPATSAPTVRVDADSEHGDREAGQTPGSALVRALPPKPHHYYFQLRAGYDLFCVLQAGDSQNLAPELAPHDWLIVKRQQSNYNMGDLVAVGSVRREVQLDGVVRLAEDCADRSDRLTFFLGRVTDQTDKQVQVDTGAGDPQPIGPEQPIQVGKVIGFFRYLPSQPEMPAVVPPTGAHAITPDCADAPDPHYFHIREGIRVYCVSSRTSDGLLPGLSAGDWLLTDESARDPAEHDPVVISDEHAGSIRAQAGDNTNMYVGEVVQEPETGELVLLVAEERRIQLQPQMVLGTVVGFFRNLAW
jgi:hypothetical protein